MLPIARPRHHAANAVHPPASQHGVFNAGWMLVALLFTCAWWIGLWDLHAVKSWDIGSIAFYFAMAAGIYLYARLVSPRIPG